MTAAATTTAPDLADLRYGPHERNVLDLWRPRQAPAPLLIWIHGGGFMGGSKALWPEFDIDAWLADGFAVASIHYRLTDAAPYPAQMHDACRALQFLRLHAEEHGIDPHRVACAGGSAGAGISQWIGYRDDLADPASDDPVLRMSTRISAIGAFNMQCTYDPRIIRGIVPGKAYDHVAMKRLFGVGDGFDWDRDAIPPAALARIEACGPLSLLRPSAPPVFIANNAGSERDGDIHHPNFGRHLAQRLREVGVPFERHLDSDYHDGRRGLMRAFRHFLREILVVRAAATPAAPASC